MTADAARDAEVIADEIAKAVRDRCTADQSWPVIMECIRAQVTHRLRALSREPVQGWTTVTDDEKTWPPDSRDLILAEYERGGHDAVPGLLAREQAEHPALNKMLRWMPWPSAAHSPPPLLALVREWAEAGGDPALRATSERMRSPPGRVNAVLRLQRAEEALRRAAGGAAELLAAME